ncbi:beta-glucosidase D protein [Rutstroemia sp. NJR-2017a BBW]|nr:beta-glucosidase D protein [Rutstroemia sp. NJR-2017a BBW]
MLLKQLLTVGTLLPSAIHGNNLPKRANTVATSNATSTATGILSNGLVDLGEWKDAYDQAVTLVSGMTNAEKLSIITGGSVESSSNWTALSFKDGTQGPQGYDYVTGWCQSSALAMTWDKALMSKQFSAVGLEFYLKGFQVIAGPTSQPLGRNPWGGRLVETLGVDSYLNGIAFGLGAKSFSDVGVIAGGKHFLLNEQETNRTSSGSGFGGGGGGGFGGGSGGPGGSMSGNGTAPTSGNETAPTSSSLTTRQETNGTSAGSDGSSTSTDDSGSAPYTSNVDDKALHETYLWPFYDGVKGGMGATMCAMTKVNGTLSCENSRLLNTLLKTELGFPGLVWPDQNGQSSSFDSADAGLDYGSSQYWSNDTLLTGIANGSFTQERLDDMAVRNVIAYYKVNLNNGTPETYEGHLAGGAGSGQTSFPYLITPQQALTYRASQDGTMIRWILNNTYTESTTTTISGLSGGTALAHTISAYSTDAEACLVFLNAFSGEGADRTELRNTEPDSLVTSVASTCANTIVIINTVGPRLVDTWITHINVTAVLYGGLLGQESGNSIVDVLYGSVNPSGRLPYTLAKNESDYNVQTCLTAVCNFTEGNYIDYKYFDKYNVTPRYEFGYGLSYTNFTYGTANLTITNSSALSSIYPTGVLSVGGKADLWDEVIRVSLPITNSGAVDGNEVAQLYVQFPEEADAPVRQLRGFEKWGEAGGDVWGEEEGSEFLGYGGAGVGGGEGEVGASSRDLRARVEVTVD